MKLASPDFKHNGSIPDRLAFGIPDPATHLTLGPNRNPSLAWTNVPTAAKSLVLLCIDPDAPLTAKNFNQEGSTIAPDFERGDFVHWVMTDVPADGNSIAEGQCSDGVIARGKSNPIGPAGSRQGINDYTKFFSGDPDMKGNYYGYDGPCPPWNDEKPHRYDFTLYALDVERLELAEGFTCAEVQAAMQDHIVEIAKLTGIYTLNPALR